MRSAETSGAGAVRFGAGNGEASKRTARVRRSATIHRIADLRHHKINLAIAAAALGAATLFVAYDSWRTLDSADRELTLVGAAVSAELSHIDPVTATSALDGLAAKYSNVVRASLVSHQVAAVMPMPVLSEVIPVGDYASLALEADQSEAWTGIAQRGIGAFGLAFGVIFLAMRREGGVGNSGVRRESYRSMAAAIPMGVACWTAKGDLVVCNDQYRERLDLAGSKVSYHEAVRKLIVGGYMKLLREDESNRLLELHREDGSCLLIDERPLADGGFLTLVSDVTERKKTDTLLNAIREEQRLLARRYHEEKLKAEAASRSKTNFLAHLSHDIRTPLNHIIGFAELMRHQTYGPLGDPRYDDYVKSIKTSGEHLLASFATILDLAELEGGQKELRSDPVSIDELLDATIQRFRPRAKRVGVSFVLSEPCGAVVQGDRLGLTRMLDNIIDNSLRFTPSGGKVTLAAFAARDGVVIEITDTGLGMDEERLASLSQPFALGDATFTRDGIGPGLGISISRAIAELSGGHLAIDSSPALGTTVAISLPLQADDQLQAAE